MVVANAERRRSRAVCCRHSAQRATDNAIVCSLEHRRWPLSLARVEREERGDNVQNRDKNAPLNTIANAGRWNFAGTSSGDPNVFG